MKYLIPRILALLPLLALADTPELVTMDSVETAQRTLSAYQANQKTFRVRFVDSGVNTVLSNKVPYMYWATTDRATNMVTSTWSIVSSVSGLVDFTFSPTDLNYSNGISTAIYGVGLNPGPHTHKTGRFIIKPDPYATGAAAIHWSTQSVNWVAITWIGLPTWLTNESITIDGVRLTNGVVITSGAATNGINGVSSSNGITAALVSNLLSIGQSGLATGTPVYAESDPVWTGASSDYLTRVSAAGLYATGTPLYVESWTGSLASISHVTEGSGNVVTQVVVGGSVVTARLGTVTGGGGGSFTNVNASNMEANSPGYYATGMPIYVEAGTGTLVDASIAKLAWLGTTNYWATFSESTGALPPGGIPQTNGDVLITIGGSSWKFGRDGTLQYQPQLFMPVMSFIATNNLDLIAGSGLYVTNGKLSASGSYTNVNAANLNANSPGAFATGTPLYVESNPSLAGLSNRVGKTAYDLFYFYNPGAASSGYVASMAFQKIPINYAVYDPQAVLNTNASTFTVTNGVYEFILPQADDGGSTGAGKYNVLMARWGTTGGFHTAWSWASNTNSGTADWNGRGDVTLCTGHPTDGARARCWLWINNTNVYTNVTLWVAGNNDTTYNYFIQPAIRCIYHPLPAIWGNP
jgi:hypothetical protein